MNKDRTSSTKAFEQGFVSIIVAMIIMAVVILITTSFALLMQRNQRQVLDRQLSTQAFYAAESGVNDAIAAIKGGFTGDVTKCSDTHNITDKIGGNQQLDSSTNVEFSCVLISESPDHLEYNPVSTDNSTIVHVHTNGGNLSSTRISWQDSGSSNTFVPNNSPDPLLPEKYDPSPDAFICALTSSCFNTTDGTGILRITLMPVRNVNSISRDNLISDAATYFLYPKANNASSADETLSYQGNTIGKNSNNGDFIYGNCNQAKSPRFCNVIINGLNTADMYVRIKSIYRTTSVSMKFYNASGPLTISGAQAVIDSTGKAQDVLRRIQVRVPLGNSYYFPEYAIQSADTLCKRLRLAPNTDSSTFPLFSIPNSGPTPGIDYNHDLDSIVCNPTQP